ncbi:MAG TPA: hypothetical protein VKE74_01920 [Gemmataceae bacterium]|nr:hypothetical protein [Gemmataceae bacterium]
MASSWTSAPRGETVRVEFEYKGKASQANLVFDGPDKFTLGPDPGERGQPIIFTRLK